MSVNSLTATNAYRNQLKMMQDAADGNPDNGGKIDSPFMQLMESALKEAVNTQYKAENVQMQSLTGKVELTDLVAAVSNAELSLNTVVAVRDRVINAYQDILKMPI